MGGSHTITSRRGACLHCEEAVQIATSDPDECENDRCTAREEACGVASRGWTGAGVLAQAFQLETLLNVLERRGVVWKAEVLEEIKRLRAKSVKAR